MDSEAQDDELLVLSSIYEEFFHRSTAEGDNKGGELMIHLDLTDSITLTAVNGRGRQEQVQYLPPIYLHFWYPSDYPSAAPPVYTLTCKWITRPQLSLVCQELDRLWEENKGDVILYTWSQYIKEECLSLLKIGKTLDVDSMRPMRSELVRRQSTVKEDGGVNELELNSRENKVENPQVNKENIGSDVRYEECSLRTSSVQETSDCDSSKNNIANNSRDSSSSSSSKLLNTSSRGILEGGAAAAVASSAVSDLAVIERQHLAQLGNIVCDERTVQDVGPKTNILMLLREYDQEKRRFVFLKKSFPCHVCFCDKIGSQCMEFWPCGHVYCKECMKGYFEVQIKEGNFKFLKCPNEKCNSEANPKQVEELVSAELYERWDTLLLSNTISALGDTQPCPRQHCQYPATLEQNLGHCPACSFVFCALCRYGDHGLNPCRMKAGEARRVLDEYINGNSATRKRLETRFGKSYLTKLSNELLTMEYISENAKQCPRCSRNIEKSDGCNKMLCQGCGVSFCWLCVARLDPSHPYSHFNSPTSRCFNKLFEGVDSVEEEDEFFIDEMLPFLRF
uniref:RBR-type E3 ubiquitin transferase n=1 Tax=Hirondellea gigas TaxID=1518452 RepID=A0A2P2I4I4_9CRUS